MVPDWIRAATSGDLDRRRSRRLPDLCPGHARGRRLHGRRGGHRRGGDRGGPDRPARPGPARHRPAGLRRVRGGQAAGRRPGRGRRSGRRADLDPRGARLRRADRGQPGRRVPAQGSAVRCGAAPVPGPGPGMSRRLLAALIAGATATVGLFVWAAWPPTSRYVPIEISMAAVGLSFMVAGIAAWLRWPASRLGLLFTIVGYLYLVPYILVNLANPVAWTVGNLCEGLYGAAVAHLALAWPTGRLRSRFECGVVIAGYAQNVAFNLAGMLFWNPAFSGCNARCPANVLLIGDGSRSAWDTLGTAEGFVGLVVTGIVLALIVGHWRS